MKTKHSPKYISLMVIGASLLLALPLEAARGGNGGGSGGNGGQCPQGLTPGTRNMQDCTGAYNGSRSQSRRGSANQGETRGSGNGSQQNKTGTAPADGTGNRNGRGTGNGGGNGLGTGNPEDCPNNQG